jgi:hypothetical protein
MVVFGRVADFSDSHGMAAAMPAARRTGVNMIRFVYHGSGRYS